MPSGSVRFIGSMMHVANTHQDKPFVLDPESRQTTEMFPGSHESAVAEAYRRAIRTIYAQLPRVTRRQYQSGAGPVDDFDRDVVAINDRDDGRRVTFVATYFSDRFGDNASPPMMWTAVRCDRQEAGTWSCDERELEDASENLGVALSRDSDGRDTSEALDGVVQAILHRP